MSALALAPLQDDRRPGGVSLRRQPAPATSRALASAISRARQRLLSLQHPDGHWCGELQGDTILESETILLMAFLGKEKDERVRKAARYILDQQLPEGGW